MARLLKSTFFSFFILSFLVGAANAQSVPGIADPITFQMIPQYPGPRETVTVTAQSFNTDLNKAVFKWYLGGKLISSGVGQKEITFQSGAAGSLVSLSIEASTSDFGVIREILEFRPAEATLLWEADTYSPPFYKGKALHSFGGSFRVTAIPEFFDASGKRINPKNLVYTWKKNDEVQGAASGFGKDTFTGLQTSYLREGEEISVDVSSPRESIAAVARATIRPAVPEILFYESSPLYGILYESALPSTLLLSNEEVTLFGEVYNASTDHPLSGALSYSWSINGAPLANQKGNEVTFRRVPGGGESQVDLRIQHAAKVLQGGRSSITILQQ